MRRVDQQSSNSLGLNSKSIDAATAQRSRTQGAALRSLGLGLLAFGALAVSAGLVACDNSGTDAGAEMGEGDDGPEPIMLLDEHSYSSEAELKLETIETVSGKNVEVCWSDLAKDIRCHDTDPKDDIDNIALLRFRNLTKEQIEERMASGELPQSAVDGYMELNVDGEECIDLNKLDFFGSEVDLAEEFVEDEENVYVLVAATGTTPGVGARVLTFLEPKKSSDNNEVAIQDGCGTLDFEADLSSLKPLEIAKDGPWLVDWGDSTKDSLGNDLALQNIDKVLLGYYEGMSAADLEEKVMDLELIATELYEVELTGGTEVDLSIAVNDKDKAFSEFKDDGTWILAMMCTTCQNPAPLLLTILDPQ